MNARNLYIVNGHDRAARMQNQQKPQSEIPIHSFFAPLLLLLFWFNELKCVGRKRFFSLPSNALALRILYARYVHMLKQHFFHVCRLFAWRAQFEDDSRVNDGYASVPHVTVGCVCICHKTSRITRRLTEHRPEGTRTKKAISSKHFSREKHMKRCTRIFTHADLITEQHNTHTHTNRDQNKRAIEREKPL